MKQIDIDDEWDKISNKINGLFLFSDTNLYKTVSFGETMDLDVFNSVLKTLDKSIIDVQQSKEFKDGFIINSKNGKVAVQNGEVIRNNILSSGTQSGIDISYLISSIIKSNYGFYYCDEKFSYVHSEIEAALLSFMISNLQENTQLFFTSHNLDLLELNLPIHSYTFLRNECEIEPVYVSYYVKNNDVSLRNKAKNGVFNTSTNLDEIFRIEEIINGE